MTGGYRRRGSVTVTLTAAETNALQLAVTNMVESGNQLTDADRHAIDASEKLQTAWREKAHANGW